MDELTLAYGRDARVETGYQLLDSDPRRLGAITLLRRMRESFDVLESDDKPFPFLGRAPVPDATTEPLVLVKVARKPVSDLARRCLDEEEEWATATARFHSAGSDQDYAWVARGYIPGLPLHRLPLDTPSEQRHLYALWLLNEVHEWHTKHRESHLDIKPSNVLLTDERAILIDFETSVDHGSANSHVLATASFASPEQVLRQASRPIGAASDVFSWGLTVVSMFRRDFHPYCGGPFDLERFAELDRRIGSGGHPPDPDLRDIDSIGLREAVGRALAWRQEDRPSTGELIEFLNQTEPILHIKRLPLTELQVPAVDVGVSPARLMDQVRWWLSPAGPLGDREMDSYVHLIALVVAGTAGLIVGLVLAMLLGGVLGS